MPACSSGTLTNVLPHRNAMPQTQDTTPHPVTVYRHGANLSLCYPSMWNVTLEYTATHFNVLGETRPGNPSPTFHTPANVQLDAVMVVNSRKLSRKYRTNRVLNPGPVVCESSTLSARPQRLPGKVRLKCQHTHHMHVIWLGQINSGSKPIISVCVCLYVCVCVWCQSCDFITWPVMSSD